MRIKLTPFNSLRHLRLFLGKSQKEMAALGGISRHGIESVEQDRLKLSTSLGYKISQATGADFGWLMANDESLPMINHHGREYTMQDWEDAQDKDLESLKFYRVSPEMEIGVAADLLHRVLEAAYKRDVKAVSDFQRNLDAFVRREVSRFRDLQDAIFSEIRQWGEENIGTRKSYPKTFLFPRSTEPFKRGRQRADKAIAAIEDRRKRLKTIKK